MSDIKHIALFVPTMGGGGAERVVMLLANGFSERGYKVDLILVKAAGPYLNDISNSVRVVDLNCNRVSLSLWPLIRYLIAERPDAVISALRTCNIIAAIARKISSVPTRLVISEHSNFKLRMSGPQWRPYFLYKIMRFAYRMADEVVAVSEGVARELEEGLHLKKGSVLKIYNPVLTKTMLAALADRQDTFRYKRGSPPVILSVGRLVKEKDFPTLIRAFEIVKKSQDARLLILGEGNMRACLEEMIIERRLADHVDMPGFVTDPFSYMKSSSVFVISSELEAFGNVLVEAMACGIPVVATATSGPVEILEGGKWGRIVPIGKEEELADAIIESLKSGTTVDATQRALRFDVDNALDQYIAAIFPRYDVAYSKERDGN